MTLELIRGKCRTDLYFFIKGVLGFDWLVPKVHGPMCRLLEDPENTRLRFVLPRSWLKSTVMIGYAVWRAVKNPNIRILIVQNSHSNACKKLAVIRGLFEGNVMLRTLFPDVLPDKTCTWTSDSLCLRRSKQNAESTFESAGTRTRLIGRHFNIIIEDDTVAPDLDDLTAGAVLPSKEDVDQAIGWHNLALPYLVDATHDQIIITGTRWFEKDLISWNEDNEPQYKSYKRAVRETNGIADEDGEVVYPEKFPAKLLDELAQGMGPYLYSCLYMNKPIRSDKMVFQPEWFKFYETTPRDVVCYTTVDLAGDPAESKGDPDYNVIMTCGKDLRTGAVYVLDYFRERCSMSEVVQTIFDHVRRFKPIKVGIESVAYQKAIITVVRERMRSDNLYFHVEGITHGKQSKNTRIQWLQPLVKAGMLRFRTHHKLLITELCAFPLAAYDDLGDALSMQLPMWALTRSVEEEHRTSAVDDPMTFDHAEAELMGRPEARLRETNPWLSTSNN